MTINVTIDAGDTIAEFVEKTNNMFGELYDPDWFTATMSGSEGATQSISSGAWTTITLDAYIGDESTGNVRLEDNKIIYAEPSGFGADQGIGFSNQIVCLAWSNTAVGLARHVRKVRIVVGDDVGVEIIPGVTVTEFVGAYGEEIFDPAVGTSGEMTTSFIQTHLQPGWDEAMVNPYCKVQVWHNAGQAVNIVKVGMQSPVCQNVRMCDDERFFPDFVWPEEPPNV